MEQTIKQRLMLFIEHLGISMNAFERECGLGKRYVANIRKSIQPDTLEKIALTYPQLNKGWLMTGEGTMLKETNTSDGSSPCFDVATIQGGAAHGTGDHLSYFADGMEYEVQGAFYIQDDGTPQHTHIFPDGIEMEVYLQVTDRQRIGKRIAQLRNEAGMSQARLAELTGMEQPHIARIEAGRYSVGVDILGKIATALGKRVDIVD